MLAGGDERDLASFHDRRHAHRDRLGGDVVLPEKIGGRIAARDGIERDQARARLDPRARLVEPDVTGLADAEYLDVDPSGITNRLLVGVSLGGNLVTGDVAARDMDILRANIDLVEEILPHVAVVAVDAVRPHRIVLVEIERHDVGEVQTLLAVEPRELAVDPDRRAAGCQSENCARACLSSLDDDVGNSPRYPARDFVVLGDNDWKSLSDLRAHFLASQSTSGASTIAC